MFAVFDVPSEIEASIRIHFNVFLLGLGRPISHGHPPRGLLIRAAAKAVARRNCSGGNLSESGGTFPFLTSFSGNACPKFAKGDKLWNALVIAGMTDAAKRDWIGKSGIAS